MLGWVLIVTGVALLVLPGPGIVLIAAGLTVLSQEYPWAKSRLKPIRARAIVIARASVRSWRTVTISVIIPLTAMIMGAVWIWHPPAPGWWSFGDRWWLPGGWGVGSSLILSSWIALGLLICSYWRFRTRPTPETVN